MNKELALTLLKNVKEIEGKQFDILKVIAEELNQDPDSNFAKELILRSLENKKHFKHTFAILNDLVRSVGLFPYLDDKNLCLSDKIAFNFFKPENLDGIVFHLEQFPIYQKLLNGKNIVLSAPTSFGKSKIIDAVIAKECFKNIVIVVPTLALIDETRRRLTNLFSSKYHIVSHPTQLPENGKNIFIFTPERVVAYKNEFPQINFFVIDEFYKIGGQSESDERVVALNEAFYYLYKKQKAQFYMLGPNIQTISEGAGKKFNFEFISTDYNTVINEVIPIHATSPNDRLEKLLALCAKIKEPSLIYCKSISQVYAVAEKLCELKTNCENLICNEMSDWLGEEFHPDWVLAKGVRKGIGIHIGPLPRAIAQDVVAQFNEGNLQFLVCTSTLIEGVNTKAKNVIIYENKIAKKQLDFFTFNNIKGRSGRMFEHFIGKVYRFDDEPQMNLPFVELPIYEQNENTPTSLLIQLDDEDLTKKSKMRIEKELIDSPLPKDLIKENHGLEPELQIEVFNHIINNLPQAKDLLRWTRNPSYEELAECCKIIWNFWIKSPKNGVFSSSQLCFKIMALKRKASYKDRILGELEGEYAATSVNEAVSRILGFDRNWASFDFPQYLMSLDRIQKFAFEQHGITPGDYSSFAKQIESLFLPEQCMALDEFGIPVNVSKEYPVLANAKSLQESLDYLKNKKFKYSNEYVKRLIEKAKEGL